MSKSRKKEKMEKITRREFLKKALAGLALITGATSILKLYSKYYDLPSKLKEWKKKFQAELYHLDEIEHLVNAGKIVIKEQRYFAERWSEKGFDIEMHMNSDIIFILSGSSYESFIEILLPVKVVENEKEAQKVTEQILSKIKLYKNKFRIDLQIEDRVIYIEPMISPITLGDRKYLKVYLYISYRLSEYTAICSYYYLLEKILGKFSEGNKVLKYLNDYILKKLTKMGYKIPEVKCKRSLPKIKSLKNLKELPSVKKVKREGKTTINVRFFESEHKIEIWETKKVISTPSNKFDKLLNELIRDMKSRGYLRKGMDHMAILLAVAKYLADRLRYASEIEEKELERNTLEEECIIAIKKGYGVCRHYAFLYASLCNKIFDEEGYDNVRVFYIDGIPYIDTFMTITLGPHAWNSVAIYDEKKNLIYYLDGVDVTWYDISNRLIWRERFRIP